jgi:formate dehydrogenase subunit gamma
MRRIERFCKTPRWFHWSFVVPFLGLAGSGAALALREPLGLGEEATQSLVRAHLALAACWLLAPPLVLLSGQTRAALADLLAPLRFGRDDLRWLALQPLAALGRAELPPAGKLNGGQKLNALLAANVSIGLAATGLWLWRHPGALVPWLAHLALFALWLPAFAGHFYLAVLHPPTRHALRAMFAGDVDLDWARHHHPLWVAEVTRTPLASEATGGAAPEPVRAVGAAVVRERPLVTGTLADEQA